MTCASIINVYKTEVAELFPRDVFLLPVYAFVFSTAIHPK